MLDPGAALGIALPIGVGMAALGSGLGLGRAVEGATSAMGRQPQAAGKIQLAMIIGCGFIEALTIYALVVVFLLMGKVPEAGAVSHESEPTARAVMEQQEHVSLDDRLAEAGIAVDGLS